MDEIIVGRDRIETIRALTDLWDEVLDGRGSRIAMVYGGRGSGKTAVLRALYRHCAMRQRIPGFWPRDFEAVRGEPLFARQIIHPTEGVGEKSSEPQFVWWGIEAQPDHCAVQDCSDRLKPVELLARRIEEPGISTFRLLKLGADATMLFAPLLPIVAAIPVVSAFGIGLGAVGVTSDGISIARNLATKRARQEKDSRVFRADHATRRKAEIHATAEVLAWIGDVMPLAIVVDNAEHIDELSVQLLRHIVEVNAKQCLIVFAVNDESSVEREPYTHLEEWLDGIADSEESDPHGERTFYEFDLEKLPSEEMLEIALHELGVLTPDPSTLAALLEEADGVPGRLLELLSLPVVCGAIERGNPLPGGLPSLGEDRVLDQRLGLLPADTRQALSVLALHGPMTHYRWAVKALSVSSGDSVSVLQQWEESGWLRRTDALVEFGSPAAYRAAVRGMDNVLTAGQKNEQLDLLLKMVREDQSVGLWREHPAHLCESVLVTLLDSSGSHGPLDVDSFERNRWQAEHLRLRTATGRGLFADDLEAIEKRLSDGVPSVPLVVATAEALFEAGHIERAQAVLERELHRLEGKYGSDHKSIISPLQSLAVFYAAQCNAADSRESRGRFYKFSVESYMRLLDLMEKKLESTDKRIPDTRYAFAKFLASVFQYRAASEVGKRVVIEMERCPDYGPDHPDTLATRNNVASLMGETGDVAGALELFAALLPDMVRVLGADHPSTLGTRHNVASLMGKTGDVAGALELFAALLPDRVRVLGADHPDTLATRNNVAYWTGETGDVAGALELFAALLPDRVRVLGADHPDTLATRNNVASLMGKTGDVAGALELFAALLPDRVRVLGADHPDTLATRNNVAYWTGETGDVAGALELVAALLPDRVRVLGADHPDTLATRNNVAYWTGETGDVAGALELFAALLPDRVRVLGADHPSTLATRNNVASLMGKTGDVAGALELFAALLPDRVRVLGADHPDTLATRNNVAYWTGETGDVAGALELVAALLPDRVRVLGADHPSTLATRNNVASLMGKTGDVAGALELVAALLPDMVRVLGADHPSTLGTRNNVAYWTGETGDVAGALELFAALLPDMVRVLGADHPFTLATRSNVAYLTKRADEQDRSSDEADSAPH